LQSDVGGKGPLKASGPICCSKSRLLSVLSGQILKISSDGDSCRQIELEEGGKIKHEAPD